jgi:hypothetical protein
MVKNGLKKISKIIPLNWKIFIAMLINYPMQIPVRLAKYKYDPSKYKDSFISTVIKTDMQITYPVRKIVYCFWTGDNPITENRQRCLTVLQDKLGVELCLVTKDKLNKYILPNYPLHPAYEFLSLIHRSDYLRCYFMNFYGGGYTDIKENLYSWSNAFDKLNSRNDKYIIGYPEIYCGACPVKGQLGIDLRKNYFRLIGNGAFIAKPQTPFTNEWFKHVTALLDENHKALKENPGNQWGTNIGYPLRWTAVQGEIFHPLVLKYNDKILRDKSLSISTKNYR